jgi:hypothetical protein
MVPAVPGRKGRETLEMPGRLYSSTGKSHPRMWHVHPDNGPALRLVRRGAQAPWQALRDAAQDQQLPCAADPDSWFPDETDHEHSAQAIKLCGACPVTEECRAFAIANRERHGIWGGQTERARRTELDRRQPARHVAA